MPVSDPENYNSNKGYLPGQQGGCRDMSWH